MNWAIVRRGIVTAMLVVIYGIFLFREISGILVFQTEAERIGNIITASGVGLLATFVLLMAIVWLLTGVKERAKRS